MQESKQMNMYLGVNGDAPYRRTSYSTAAHGLRLVELPDVWFICLFHKAPCKWTTCTQGKEKRVCVKNECVPIVRVSVFLTRCSFAVFIHAE